MSRLVISAVIPTRNRPDDLLHAVESTIKQKRQPDELLIIDQSTDDISKKAVSKLFVGLDTHIALKYILDASIAGLVAAKETAIAKSSGDLIMFLEDDVVLLEDYIANMEQGFIENSEMMGSCGLVVEVPVSNAYERLFHLFHRGIFHDERVGLHGNRNGSLKEMIPSSYLSGGLSAYRREVFERIRFDTKNDFFMLEDINFSTRAVREFGREKFFINTTARLEHRMSAANRNRFKLRYDRKLREYICFYKLNSEQKSSFACLLWLLAGLFLEAFFEFLKSFNFGPLKGYFTGLFKGIRQKVQPV